jgi:hypothetical protein
VGVDVVVLPETVVFVRGYRVVFTSLMLGVRVISGMVNQEVVTSVLLPGKVVVFTMEYQVVVATVSGEAGTKVIMSTV